MTLTTHMTMFEAFTEVAEPRWKQLAMINGERRETYGMLLDRSRQLASALLTHGIHKGDHVVAFLSPGSDFACLFFALAKIGAVFIPLNPQLRPRSLGQVLQDAQPVMLFVEQPVEESVLLVASGLKEIIVTKEGASPSVHDSVSNPEALTKTGDQHFGAGVERAGQQPPASPEANDNWAGAKLVTTLEKLLEEGRFGDQPAEPVIPQDLLILLYTSGTTGTPKGTMHSHRSLIAPVVASLKIRDLWLKHPSLKSLGQTAKALARYKTRLLRVAGRPQVFLSTVGWHAITGIEVMLQALLMGDTIVVLPHFHPRQTMELIQKEKVTILVAMPTAYQAILSMPDFDQYDTSSMLICGTGAMPCSPELGRQIQERFGCALHIGFGSTEVAGGIAIPDIGDSSELQATTVGKPLPGVQVKIVDEARNELAVGQVGELICKGDMVMMGYYQAPKATSEVIDQDGWYATGDLARLDEAGYLHIMGRKKDLIIRSGQNIYPAEIESYLITHPDIQEAAVVGVPSAVSGEEVWAFIILKPGRELSILQVLTFCRKELEPFKIPNQVRFVTDFPRTELGKPQKFRLCEYIQAESRKDS